MNAAPIHLADELLHLDPAGIVWWPGRRCLIVADLHLEKGSAMARRGAVLPPFDSRTTLERLAVLVRRYDPARLIALGDSFHDSHGAARLEADDKARLATICKGREIVWVQGNHDPAPQGGIEGVSCASLTEGRLVFRHQAERLASGMGELSGHFHPKASIDTRGKRIARPCFVAGGGRIMLPSFGAYTGGLDVTDAAIRAVFPRGGRAFLLGQNRLYSFALGHTASRRLSA
ncbi:MAG: phosphoesterase [Rhodospirillales bacterium 20-60-12]|nr:MAG: phosphoesterase [Rhodospirillales bacterium 20-60-12]HQT68073.1 ligase-associated DNA damage response endonuclease PdeM [Acetobacteraceae bacterium]